LKSDPGLLFALRQEDTVKQSQDFLENAENCAQLAERAADEPTHNRYKRMEAAWRALAEEQDWLDGQVPPVRIAS
jgi:flagellar capping protein FliD